MGVVIKQSFWASVITYLGVLIGYINSLILLPYYLDKEQYGLVRLVQSNGMLLIPIGVLGLNGAFIKYYPKFKDDRLLTNKIISFHLAVMCLALMLITSLMWIFKSQIDTIYAENSSIYNRYLYATVVIFAAQSLFTYFISFAWSHKNIIFTNFLNEVFLRILSTLILFVYGFGVINFEELVLWICGSYILTTVVLLVYIMLVYHYRFDWHFLKLEKHWIKESLKFGSYNTIVNSSATILLNISYPITASYIGLEANAILTISIYIGTLVELPKRAITQIISPIITQAFSDRDMKTLSVNYQKASVNLGILGVLLAIGIICNLESMYEIMPNGEYYKSGYWLIVIICLAKFLNMIGGVSPEIMTYSSFYKLNYIISPFNAVTIIILNILLIPRIGIIGSGISSLVTIVSGQAVRQGIIYYKLKLLPYTMSHLKIILIGTVTMLFAYFFPSVGHPMLDIVLRSGLVTIIFVGLIYSFKVSDEINHIIGLALKKIGL